MKRSVIVLLAVFIFMLCSDRAYAAVSQPQLDSAIGKAETYYEGLYKDLGSKGAVVNEYYSSPKNVYTVRHGVVGGIYYYTYTQDATKAAQLTKFAKAYGFTPDNDIHSFIWKDKSNQPTDEIYSNAAYHDCNVSLPTVGNEIPYHSKVCKLGDVGLAIYENVTKQDTLLPTIAQLQQLELGKTTDLSVVSDLQSKFTTLGNGMPICFMNQCGDVASTIRTAEFGELELRLGDMAYADKAATALLKAQTDKGAIYFSYDKSGRLKDDKGLAYKLINLFLSDDPIFKGYIPTNAETMNDVLAFLLHYRCTVYHSCGR